MKAQPLACDFSKPFSTSESFEPYGVFQSRIPTTGSIGSPSELRQGGCCRPAPGLLSCAALCCWFTAAATACARLEVHVFRFFHEDVYLRAHA